MGVVLYNKGYQMIELFIPLQLIQVLTPGSNLINFYTDQKEVGCVCIFHINKVWFVILSKKKKWKKNTFMESMYNCLMNINSERK